MLSDIIFCVVMAIMFVIGFETARSIYRKDPVGCIHVDETNPDKDVYTFEFYIPPYAVNEMKEAKFDVRRKNTDPYRKEVNKDE